MADVLVRNIPDEVLAAVDAHAERLGISRVEYIRRRLAADAALVEVALTPHELRVFGERFADLATDEVMDAAWR